MQQKWWEYYAVRYFAGTVVGAVIIAFLAKDEPYKVLLPERIVASLTGDFFGVGLAAALGFSFCYVASSPMLTLHAARAHLGRKAFPKHPWWFRASVLIPFVVAQVMSVRFPYRVAWTAGLLIGAQIWLIVLAVATKFHDIEEFYRDLAKARGVNDNGARTEFIESYRHLREHGNAVSIVILEFVLTFALVSATSRRMALAVVFLWLLPSVFAWALGSVMERRLAENPL